MCPSSYVKFKNLCSIDAEKVLRPLYTMIDYYIMTTNSTHHEWLFLYYIGKSIERCQPIKMLRIKNPNNLYDLDKI